MSGFRTRSSSADHCSQFVRHPYNSALYIASLTNAVNKKRAPCCDLALTCGAGTTMCAKEKPRAASGRGENSDLLRAKIGRAIYYDSQGALMPRI